jgi:hypothetical protein
LTYPNISLGVSYNLAGGYRHLFPIKYSIGKITYNFKKLENLNFARCLTARVRRSFSGFNNRRILKTAETQTTVCLLKTTRMPTTEGTLTTVENTGTEKKKNES